jgi:hypothetical protein
MEKSRYAVICDDANLVLGVVLCLSPWLFAFAPGAESWNAWAAGIIIALLSIAALFAFAEWKEWLNLIAGLWVVVSPCVLQFSGSTHAMRTDVIVGVIVVVIAAIEIWMAHRIAAHVTGSR